MKRTTLVTAGLLGTLVSARAQAADAPDFFLKGITSRVDGMGRAFVAIADDATAIQFNPAGLADQQNMNLNTTYSTLNDFDITTNTLNLAYPLRSRNGWGFQLYRNTIGNILGSTLDPVTSRPTVTGTTDEDEFGFHIGYGWRISNRVRLGTSLKYLSYEFFNAKESGFALDFGGIIDLSENWTFGANLQNLGGLNLGPDQVPTNLKIGVAYQDNTGKFKAAFDIDTEVANETQAHLGLEYKPIPELAARIGSNDGDLTLGLGLDLGNWGLDYSFNDQDLGDLQKITVIYRPKMKKEMIVEKSTKSIEKKAVKKDAKVKPVKAKKGK